MPVQLLQAPAFAFDSREFSVTVVLGSKVEPWLAQTLKRVNRVKRPLNSVPQHQRCLTETLSSPNSIWTLASLMLPKLPQAEMPQEPLQGLFSYQLVHIEAYIVRVDMVLRSEVAYKLTTDTIDDLIEYHENIHCANAKANTYDWSEKEQHCKKLHEDFVQAVNKFVYRTPVSALEGLEEEGAGELLCGKSEEVKENLFGLMKPLLPPPPRSCRCFAGNGLNLCYVQHSGYGGYGDWIRGARQIVVSEANLKYFVIDSYIRLESGDIVGAVSLNSTFNTDSYLATPDQLTYMGYETGGRVTVFPAKESSTSTNYIRKAGTDLSQSWIRLPPTVCYAGLLAAFVLVVL